jgi:hypothetical protein
MVEKFFVGVMCLAINQGRVNCETVNSFIESSKYAFFILLGK